VIRWPTKLLQDPDKNLAVIMKDGKVYKNTLGCLPPPLLALSEHSRFWPSGLLTQSGLHDFGH
jgi:hypothetical protein